MSWPNSKFSIETEARNAPKLCSWLWFLLRSAALINIWYISRTYSLEGSQIVLHAIYRNNFICHWNVVTSEVKGRAENRNIAAMMWKKGRLILKADELSFLEPESEPLKPTYFKNHKKKPSVMPYHQVSGSPLLLKHSDPVQQLFGFVLSS